MPSTLLIALGLALVLVGLTLVGISLLWMKHLKNQNQSQEQWIQNLLKQNQDLLNRLMSQDLRTYSTMTALQSSQGLTDLTSDPYYSQRDQDIVARMEAFGGTQGLGDPIYQDEESIEFLKDFGIDLDTSRE